MSSFLTFPPAIFIFLLVMIIVILLMDVWTPFNFKREPRGNTLVYYASLGTLLILLAWVGLLYPTARQRFFGGHLIWDGLAGLLGIGILMLSLFSFIYAQGDLKTRQLAENDYYLLGLFSILGMLVLVSAGSLLSLYLGLELMSLPLYAMVSLERQNNFQSEAAIKYAVMGAVTSAFLLYGFSLLYSMDHSLMLTSLFRESWGGAVPLMMSIGIVLVLGATAFKLGVAPFHFWAPDVYQSAPVAVGALISTAPKLAVLGMVLRLILDSFPFLFISWGDLFLILGGLSVILGNWVALAQTQIRRLLAYSSIANMGYVCLGLSAKIMGCTMAIFYSMSYALSTACVFGVLAILRHAGRDIEAISDLRSLNTHHAGLAFVMLLALLSMAGLPPLVGFMAKLGILQALLSVGQYSMACLALFFSAVGAYYYLNIIRYMYFDEISGSSISLLSKTAFIVVSGNALLLLILGLAPDLLMDYCRQVIAMIPALRVPTCLP